MRKVMCIKSGTWMLFGFFPVDFGPKYGETCTVVEETKDGYFLEGYCAGDEGYIFKKAQFIPVSDIDETEMVRDYQTDKVSV